MGRDFFDYHQEEMRDPEYRAALEALEPEFAVARALIQARADAGLTQADMAARLGVTQPAVARMESGKNVSIKSITRYATAAGRPITIEIRPQQCPVGTNEPPVPCGCVKGNNYAIPQ